MQGAYGYTLTGYFFDNSGNYHFYSSVGSFVADGLGNLTGKETDSSDGGVVRFDPYKGSYSVNSDCTGTFSTNSSSLGIFNYDFVLTNGGAGLQVVENDSGTNIQGTGAHL